MVDLFHSLALLAAIACLFVACVSIGVSWLRSGRFSRPANRERRLVQLSFGLSLLACIAHILDAHSPSGGGWQLAASHPVLLLTLGWSAVGVMCTLPLRRKGRRGALLVALAIGTTAAPEWQLMQSMAVSRSEISAAVLHGKLYVAGGISRFRITRSAEVYDPKTNTWSRIARLPRRLHHISLASCGAYLFGSGGYRTLRFGLDKDASLWRYNVEADEWSQESSLVTPVAEHGMVCHENSVYLIGGTDESGTTGAVRRYDLAEGEWVDLAEMPTPRYSAATVLAAGKIYVIGGRSRSLGAHLQHMEAYDIETDTWETLQDLPVGRGGHAASLLDGRIHVVGGENFDTNLVMDYHDVYDPGTDSWSAGRLLARPRHGLAMVTMDRCLYALGGASRAGLRTIYSASKVVQKHCPSE